MAQSRLHSGLASEAICSETCSIPDDVPQRFTALRKNHSAANVAVILKIDPKTLEVSIEEDINGITMEELAEYMPESSPRFVAYSYKYTHDDGRVSYPLIFFFWCPPGINTKLNMMYASTKTRLLQAIQIQKNFDMNHYDDWTEKWLKGKLAFFK